MALGALHPTLAIGSSIAAVGIRPSTAHILSLFFASSYVGSIYLATLFSSSKSSRASRTAAKKRTDGDAEPDVTVPSVDDEAPKPGERDHPDTIRLRMRAVCSATLGNMLVLLGVVHQVTGGQMGWQNTLKATLSLSGISTSLSSLRGIAVDPWNSLLPYTLAPTLLLGPLVAMYLDGSLPLQGYGTISRRWERLFSGWGLVELRNYVVGPLTEELTFRSCILAVSLLAHRNRRFLVFGTPLWFGVAHAHHAWEVFKRNGRDKGAAIQAIAGSLFQLTYTTLFGWFASYLYIRTGSVVPPLAAHVFCNLMGIYLPNTAIARHPIHKWTIIGAYLSGIAGFVYGLRFL